MTETASTTPSLLQPSEKQLPISTTDIKKQSENWAHSLVDFLQTFTCKSPLFPNDFGSVVTVTDNKTLGDVFKIMIDNQIMAVPVLHSATNKPIGILSMMHIANYLTTTFKAEDFSDTFWNKLSSMFVDKSKGFYNTKISEIEASLNYSLEPAFCLEENNSLLEAVTMMTNYGCHRVLILNRYGEVANIITQSRILQTLATVVDTLPKNKSTLSELGIGSKGVISVKERDTALHAFQLMRDNKITGLPVIDANEKLIGSISVNDLKLVGYNKDYWNLLGKTVGEYMRTVRASSKNNIRPKPLAQLQDESGLSAVRCYSWQSLGFVVRHISYFGVHRIFMVDDAGKVIKVVSLSDILKAILEDESVQLEVANKQRR